MSRIARTAELTRVYRRGGEDIHALDRVDLAIETGEFLSIVGPSGSGKSTLLHLLGLLDRPTSGSVWIDGTEITNRGDVKLHLLRREKIGFIFQLHNLLPTLTALENVALPLRYAGVPIGERQKRAADLLGELGMADRLHHRPSEMSGGQQQRTAIARALANRPALVLADEPTGDVDSQTSQAIISLMRDLNRRTGQTFVIVTHDPEISAATDRVVRLADGRIIADTKTGA